MNGPAVGQHGRVSGKCYNGSVLGVVLPWDHQTCALVPDKGDVWRYCNGFREHECPWTATTCIYTAKYGHFEVLNAAAVIHGHWEILQRFWELGCAWESDTCANAAQFGYLNVVLWCHQTDVHGIVRLVPKPP
jgi:hypothetical protein